MNPVADRPAKKCGTLYDSVKELMALNQINIEKYLASYLIAGKQAWKDIFRNTLYITSNVWLAVQKGDPYPYVNLPPDVDRIFYVGETDHCGDVKPLYYNNTMNVIPRPSVKKCGCDRCQCGGICEDVNSSILTTRVLFTINGVDYIEKTWIKYNRNGDILEFKEIPTKKYNSGSGSAGDFNDDYNNDYSTGSDSMGNFSIVTNNFQRKICALEVLPCGCPADTLSNENIVNEFCSCFMPFFGRRRRRHCERFLADTNMSDRGQVKISECGTRIYYRGTWKSHKIDHDRHGFHKDIPDFLLVSYQTNGEPSLLNEQIEIPDYSKVAIWAGVVYYLRAFNSKYSKAEKDDARWTFNDKCNGIISYLNPLSPKDLADIQDAPIRW